MRLVPESNLAKVGFYQTHVGVWQEHAAALNLSPELMLQLAQQLQTAQEALAEQSRLRMEAETATQRANQAVARLCLIGGSAIRTVRTQARGTGESVYVLAQIPPVKRNKTRVAPPGSPHGVRTELRSSGWVNLTWKSRNPRAAQGVLYEIKRRVDDGAWEKLGYVPRKQYEDRTIPPGTAKVEYRLRAVRLNQKSDWTIHIVEFGSTFDVPNMQLVYGRSPTAA
jgi:hypothetical protein